MKSSRKILRGILAVWTISTWILFILDFISGNKYDSAATSLGIIYLAILGIYVSNKEYERWKIHSIAKYSGELYVIIWTLLMLIFVIGAPLSQGKFKIPAEFATIYTSVIGIYAISLKSKEMYKNLKKNK